MILSSSDILRILGADAIIRQEAKLAVVEERPGLGVDETVYIYVEKYPTISEFEATWRIWVQDNSGMGKYVLNAMTSLLPNFDFKEGHYTTTDFASDRTVVKSQEEIDREEFRDRFSGLQKGVEDRLSTVRDGRDGRDGKDGLDGLPGRDGKDGKDGRDGKDLIATEAELFDLQDVEQGIQIEPGQVLTWDGSKWTNLYVRQTMSTGGTAGGGSSVRVLDDLDDVTAADPQHGDMLVYDSLTSQFVLSQVAGGGGIPEAPNDGNYYVRRFGEWVDLRVALGSLGVPVDDPIDGGNFSTGFSSANSNNVLDGGNFTTGVSNSTESGVVDGGNYTSGSSGATYSA